MTAQAASSSDLSGKQQPIYIIGEGIMTSAFGAVGCLATKIVTTINPFVGAMLMGSVYAVSKVAYYLF